MWGKPGTIITDVGPQAQTEIMVTREPGKEETRAWIEILATR